MLEDRLHAELAEIANLGLTRRRRVLDTPCGRTATVDGKNVLNFASNDYLGLAGNADGRMPDNQENRNLHYWMTSAFS